MKSIFKTQIGAQIHEISSKYTKSITFDIYRLWLYSLVNCNQICNAPPIMFNQEAHNELAALHHKLWLFLLSMMTWLQPRDGTVVLNQLSSGFISFSYNTAAYLTRTWLFITNQRRPKFVHFTAQKSMVIIYRVTIPRGYIYSLTIIVTDRRRPGGWPSLGC